MNQDYQMEALRNLQRNIPDWLAKLDDLNGQIATRQMQLANLDEQASSSGRSIKNKGSTESLKPKDEEAAFLDDRLAGGAAAAMPPPPLARTDTAGCGGGGDPPSSPGGGSANPTPSALQRQTDQATNVAARAARAMVRKKHKSESMMSVPEAELDRAPKYRTRSMIIVYYDSYVQIFFEELVKFVSASRNLIRKAKMHAKVNQIKHLADRELREQAAQAGEGNSVGPLQADDGDKPKPSTAGGSSGAPLMLSVDDHDDDEPLPALQYTSTRQMGTVSRPLHSTAGRPSQAGGAAGVSSPSSSMMSTMGGLLPDAAPGVYEVLDKALEYVQGMCEHAAHQFLRDGDCSEEIANVKRRLAETREVADREMERIAREEPEALQAGLDESGSPCPPRRLVANPMMRREQLQQQQQQQQQQQSSTSAGKQPEQGISTMEAAPLEVDEGVEADDANDVELEIPKLTYRSTRELRRR